MQTNKAKQGNKSGIAKKVLNIFKAKFERILINLFLMQ